MKSAIKRNTVHFLIILSFGLIPAVAVQFLLKEPVPRHIHVRNFRYGKDPAVIKCNRGDTLVLTFSTDDTGHSFFLEEFDIDAKVSPGRETVEVFGVKDPTETPVITREVTLIARHKGLHNYLVSKSNYRCHVWCGPMHAFEHGKLIISPNTLLIFSLGCSLGIFFLWLLNLGTASKLLVGIADEKEGYKDILQNNGILKKLVVSRWPQTILMMLAMMLVYVVILTSLFGTKMSGRNLGVLLMWAIWLFLLIAVLTPFWEESGARCVRYLFLATCYSVAQLSLPPKEKRGNTKQIFRTISEMAPVAAKQLAKINFIACPDNIFNHTGGITKSNRVCSYCPHSFTNFFGADFRAPCVLPLSLSG
jgi:hypothetical protein